MAKKHQVTVPEPPGDFSSRFITLSPSKEIGGGNYELIGAELRDGEYYDLIKNSAGESKWVLHKTVMNSLL